MAKKAEKTVEKAEEVTSELDKNVKGNGYLEGMAPKVIKELVDQAILIEEQLKPDFAAARDALVGGKETLSMLAHKHIQHFSAADENGKRVYQAGGVKIEITFEKEKISTKILDEEE